MCNSLFKILCICAFHCLVAGKPGFGQVVNDNIANRLPLSLSQPFTSTTVGCTVENDCIDETLTGKCIVYHNDQWFYINVDSAGTYFLNISGQRCRDLRGIQVVIIDGTPCEVPTYQIVECYSTGSQDDVFIKLDALEPGRNYLINVDGYLHDFCTFTIEASREAKGIPQDELSIGKILLTRRNNRNILKWSVSADSAQLIDYFEIWRRNGKTTRSVLVSSVDIERNAKGSTQLEYSFEDEADAVPQHYKIVGVGSGSRFLFDNASSPGDSLQQDKSDANNIKLFLNYKQNSPITILIFDDISGRLLQNAHFNFDRRKDSELSYYVGGLLKQGVHSF